MNWKLIFDLSLFALGVYSAYKYGQTGERARWYRIATGAIERLVKLGKNALLSPDEIAAILAAADQEAAKKEAEELAK